LPAGRGNCKLRLMAKKNNKNGINTRTKHIFLLLTSIAIIFLSFYFRDEFLRLGSLGILGIFIINVIGSATLFLPAPGIASVIAGGIVFSPFIVAVVAALGSAIGDMVGYILGRSGKEVFLKKDSFWYTIFREIFHKYGFLFIVLFSFIPNPFFDAIGIVAGLFSYNPVRFFVYVLIGRFLRNLALAYLGAAF